MSCGPTGLYPPQAAWMVQNEWLWKETFELSSQGREPHFQHRRCCSWACSLVPGEPKRAAQGLES